MKIRLLGEGAIYEGTQQVIREQGHHLVDLTKGADLLILANFMKILRASTFRSPRIGTLCFHPSMLPRHRGRDAVYWTIKMGERVTGATWFWVDEGIDTGPIARQCAIGFGYNYSPHRLYEELIVPTGIALLKELLPLIGEGPTPGIPQDERRATYESPRPQRTTASLLGH
jgi:methionyl-tRNA formyltransferase